MKSRSFNQDKPPIQFHPIEGLEATDATTLDWLLSGGEPIKNYAPHDSVVRQWEKTEPGGLR